MRPIADPMEEIGLIAASEEQGTTLLRGHAPLLPSIGRAAAGAAVAMGAATLAIAVLLLHLASQRAATTESGLRGALELQEAVATLPVSEPYDCNAGYSNWEAGWSEDKKGWCCTNKQMGCAAASQPYDCTAGFSNWEAGWSEDKKAWCCENKQIACATTSPPFDCDAGYSNWAAGWSADKKAWCCSNRNMACSDSLTTLPISTSSLAPAPVPAPAPGPAPAPRTPCTCTESAPDGRFKPGDTGMYGMCAKGEMGCCNINALKCDGGSASDPVISTSGASVDTLPVTSSVSANTLPASTSFASVDTLPVTSSASVVVLPETSSSAAADTLPATSSASANTLPATTSARDSNAPQPMPLVGGAGSIGPKWTYDPSVEKPAGTESRGSYEVSVYTEEQQKRLGVDKDGNSVDVGSVAGHPQAPPQVPEAME